MAYQTISAFEAKTHLSSLLVQIKDGKGFMITKHDQPIALLIPYNERPRPPIVDTIAQLKRSRISLKGCTIAELKAESRK